jgi:uncharacterized hydrophobic protein (TIGR00271 family)
MERTKTDILAVDNEHRYRAIDDLIEESREGTTYYTLLILSTVIIVAGLLLANPAILIGGMLITPVLTPILLIALGIVASKPRLLKRTGLFILKSIGVILGIAFISGLVFSIPENTEFFKSALFDNSLRAAFLYFIVALASGIAATFSWVRKDELNILPGISIAVSLVPPVALVGIWLATLELELMRFYLFVFLFNLFGIIMGGLIVFSMMKFQKTERKIEAKMDEVIKEEEIEKAEKTVTEFN